MTTIHGLVPILATPFTRDGALDLDSLRRLVRWSLASGVDGLGCFGMASEAFALDDDERDEILAVITHEVGGQIPVVAGAGGTALAPALAQARRAVAGGADALMVLAPHLVKPSPEQLVDFYGSLAQQTAVPVMVQDAPALTGVGMSPDLLARITASSGVDYVKVETQPTARVVSDIVGAVSGQAAVFGGQNALFLLDELDRGAIGTMPACEMSDALRGILGDRESGDHVGARKGFAALLPLLRYGLQPGIAWAIHKHVLVERGIIDHAAVRAPARPADEHTLAGLATILDDLKLPVADVIDERPIRSTPWSG